MKRTITSLFGAALAMISLFSANAHADQGFPTLVSGHPISPRPGETTEYEDEAYWITQAAPMLLVGTHGSRIERQYIYDDGKPLFLYMTNALRWNDPWSQRIKLYRSGDNVILEDNGVPLDTCLKALKNSIGKLPPGEAHRLTSSVDETLYGVFAKLDVLVGKGKVQHIVAVETDADVNKVCDAPYVALRQTIRTTRNPQLLPSVKGPGN